MDKVLKIAFGSKLFFFNGMKRKKKTRMKRNLKISKKKEGKLLLLLIYNFIADLYAKEKKR